MADVSSRDPSKASKASLNYAAKPLSRADYPLSDDSSSDESSALRLSRYQTNVEQPDGMVDSSGDDQRPLDRRDYPRYPMSAVDSDGRESRDGISPLGAGFVNRDGTYASPNSSGAIFSSVGPATPFSTLPSMTSSGSFGQTSAPMNPLTPMSSTPGSTLNWGRDGPVQRSRGNSGTGLATIDTSQAQMPNGINGVRPQRPSYNRTSSHAYAPPRRPSQYVIAASRHRSTSQNPTRLGPEADYRAQKKAYVQRLQDNAEDLSQSLSPDGYPPSLSYSSETDTDGESPSTAEYADNDGFDMQETMVIYGEAEDPSAEELKIPANRERLEWYSMLRQVLTGDVVKQEKKRLVGAGTGQGDKARWTEIWMGIRAKTCGRPLAAQKGIIEEQRKQVATKMEDIIAFEIKGEAEAGKSAREQVEEVVHKIEECERLYPTRQIFEEAHSRAKSDSYKESCGAVIAWHNITNLINMELAILQAWVGNDDLDFQRPRERTTADSNLSDNASFIDRVLKEDGLKSLQGEGSLLVGLGRVIDKAKLTLIENADAFALRHLPPYIEELLTLINFPSRLVQEIIRMRLSYANRMKDPAQQGILLAEQLISQFQILLSLAVKTKEQYMLVSKPEQGWELPPCIDENFDQAVLDALRTYFKTLHWKLAVNRNTFKEAEILEQEWGFSSALGRHFEGGDVEVAEQFSALTWKSLHRLATQFEKELQRRPNEKAGAEMDKRYKQILDSVRVRQRKLFRFSRMLAQTFENTAEFDIGAAHLNIHELLESLMSSGHVLVETSSLPKDINAIASPTLYHQPLEIHAMLSSVYRAADRPEDPNCPYVLLIHTEEPLVWEGLRLDIDMKFPKFDVKPGKLRLVAEGPQHLLQNAKASFLQDLSKEPDVVIPQRASLPKVEKELQKIKRTAYKLSNTIMDSVQIIRDQLHGLECQELIQTCFAFATEFGQRSVLYMDYNRRALNSLRLTRLALDWVSFICDDCIASDRKTFRWAVVALEFAMNMTRGQNILAITDEEYSKLRSKVAGCMSLLISHFDIMGARSTLAAQTEKQRQEAVGSKFKLESGKLKNDEESARLVREEWMAHLTEIEEFRKSKEAERQALGRVLEDLNEADRSLTFLSSSATNVSLRWQQGQYIGGGTFGSVYAAINLDSNYLMAVKEIRLQDPQMVPNIVSQIRDEMGVLQILDHPNIVSYYGIEVHRDKVYIFMEYCSGGSLAGLLEHGRIEDETVIMVYALQLLEGLAYLHERGVIHRDIKPENILLDHNGVIKYVDFGAAKLIARQSGRTLADTTLGGPDHLHGNAIPNQTKRDNSPAAGGRAGRQRSMTGTPMYMSPEVIRGTATVHSIEKNQQTQQSGEGSSSGSQRSNSSDSSSSRPGAVDVWSLGCVILEMATGRRPWANLDNEWAIMYNIASGNSPTLPTNDQLSDAGIDFLTKCFEKEPTKRASAVELLQSEWIMTLRNQLSLDTGTPQTERSGRDGSMSGASGSGAGSSPALPPISAVASH